MIHPAGWFSHEVTLRRSGHRWVGVADADPKATIVTLVGTCPEISVANGELILRTTMPGPLRAVADREFTRPGARGFVARVGQAPAALLQDDDRVAVERGGTGDVSLVVRRAGALVLAIGAVGLRALAPDVIVDEDARVDDFDLQDAKHHLQRGGMELVWLDAADPDLPSALVALQQQAASMRLIAIAGPTRDARMELNRRFIEEIRLSGSRIFIDVDERFASQEQLLAYLQTLPDSRPDDLHLRFTIDGASRTLREGSGGQLGGWELYAHNVYRDNIPGTLAHFGVTRVDPSLPQAILAESVKAIAGDGAVVR